MTKKEQARANGDELLQVIATIFVIFLFLLICSPIILIWFGFGLFLKGALTLLFMAVVALIIYHVSKKLINEIVEETPDETPKAQTKSKFQEQLEQMAKERNINEHRSK